MLAGNPIRGDLQARLGCRMRGRAATPVDDHLAAGPDETRNYARSPNRSCVGPAERKQRRAGFGEAADTAARPRRRRSIEP